MPPVTVQTYNHPNPANYPFPMAESQMFPTPAPAVGLGAMASTLTTASGWSDEELVRSILSQMMLDEDAAALATPGLTPEDEQPRYLVNHHHHHTAEIDRTAGMRNPYPSQDPIGQTTVASRFSSAGPFSHGTIVGQVPPSPLASASPLVSATVNNLKANNAAVGQFIMGSTTTTTTPTAIRAGLTTNHVNPSIASATIPTPNLNKPHVASLPSHAAMMMKTHPPPPTAQFQTTPPTAPAPAPAVQQAIPTLATISPALMQQLVKLLQSQGQAAQPAPQPTTTNLPMTNAPNTSEWSQIMAAVLLSAANGAQQAPKSPNSSYSHEEYTDPAATATAGMVSPFLAPHNQVPTTPPLAQQPQQRPRITRDPGHRQLMAVRERQLLSLTVQLLLSSEINPYQGSVPIERLQGIIRNDYCELYDNVVGNKRHSWKRFLEKHDEVFQMVPVEVLSGELKWRVRVHGQTNWQEGDQAEREAINAREQHLIACLTTFLLLCPNNCCRVDAFSDAYPLLPQNASQGADFIRLPPRGDILRFVRRHPERFFYNTDTLTIHFCAEILTAAAAASAATPVPKKQHFHPQNSGLIPMGVC